VAEEDIRTGDECSFSPDSRKAHAAFGRALRIRVIEGVLCRCPGRIIKSACSSDTSVRM
jgi:hypothetical protein